MHDRSAALTETGGLARSRAGRRVMSAGDRGEGYDGRPRQAAGPHPVQAGAERQPARAPRGSHEFRPGADRRGAARPWSSPKTGARSGSSKREVAARQVANKAASGDHRATELLYKYLGIDQAIEPVAASPADKADLSFGSEDERRCWKPSCAVQEGGLDHERRTTPGVPGPAAHRFRGVRSAMLPAAQPRRATSRRGGTSS